MSEKISKEKFLLDERFISNDLIKVLEKEIHLVKKGKVNLKRSRTMAQLARLMVQTKRLEMKKENVLIRELLKEIREYEN